METGAYIAIIGMAVTIVGMVWRAARDRASIDLAIVTAERRAKHDAVNETTVKLLTHIDHDHEEFAARLPTEVYRADQAGLNRRLEVIERQLGLDGTGPHRRGTSPGE